MNLLFQIWLKRIEPFYCFEYDSKNRTFVSIAQSFSYLIQRIFVKKKNKWLKELKFFYNIWLKELNLQRWLEELNFDLFFNMTQKKWTFFLKKKLTQRIELIFMTQRIEPSFQQMGQRIETFFDWKNWTFFSKIRRKELNPFFFQHDSNDFVWYDSRNRTFFFWIRLRELNPFNTTQRIELFFILKRKRLLFSWTWR